jgi:group I intron endonuclease
MAKNGDIGIYRIINNINGHSYIGKGATIEARWQRHKENARKGKKTHLYNAIRFYGWEKFTFEKILILGENNSKILNCMERSFIQEFHTFYLDPEYKGGYNETPGGDGGALHGEALNSMRENLMGRVPWNKNKPWSQETKEKMRLSHLGKLLTSEQKEKIGQAHRGMKRPPETGLRISIALKGKPRPLQRGKPSGMAGKIQSEDARRKISESNKGKHSAPRGSMPEEQKQRIRESWTDKARIAASERAKNQKKTTGWHHSEEAKQKMSLAKKGKPATNRGIARTQAQKENDRIVKLKAYLKRGRPCIKCTHCDTDKSQYFVSTNEVAIRLVGITGAMTTVQHLLDNPEWVSPKPKSRVWKFLKDYRFEYCSQNELLMNRPELLPI